jgi:thioredoxin reductase
VFGALDPIPNSGPFSAVAAVDAGGTIMIDQRFAVETSPRAAPGLFAAGDIRTGSPMRAGAAAGDGIGAAIAIASFVRGTGT